MSQFVDQIASEWVILRSLRSPHSTAEALRSFVILNKATACLNLLELVDVLETGAFCAFLLAIDLSVENIRVGTTLPHIDVELSHHPVFELLLSACTQGHVKLVLDRALRIHIHLRPLRVVPLLDHHCLAFALLHYFSFLRARHYCNILINACLLSHCLVSFFHLYH